jgi:hypothetical protein
LPEADHSVGENDGKEHAGLDPVLERERENGDDEQNDDYEVLELAQNENGNRGRLGTRQLVATESLASRANIRLERQSNGSIGAKQVNQRSSRRVIVQSRGRQPTGSRLCKASERLATETGHGRQLDLTGQLIERRSQLGHNVAEQLHALLCETAVLGRGSGRKLRNAKFSRAQMLFELESREELGGLHLLHGGDKSQVEREHVDEESQSGARQFARLTTA